MSEDKMREEQAIWESVDSDMAAHANTITYHEEAYKAGVKACAAIKDAEIANLVYAEAEAMALVLNHEGHIEKLNAKIAEHRELWKDLRNVLEQTQKSLVAAEKEIAARDLIIKELREALHNIHCNWDEMYPEDIILGIGTVHDEGLKYVRYLHLSKNKLDGDEDTQEEQRHGKMEVLIKPEIARYADFN